MTSSVHVNLRLPLPPRPPRLVASDLDGTLLDPREQISPRTLAAIELATAAGVRVVAATGRQVAQLPPALAGSGITHAVGSNGAICIEMGGDILFEDLLPASTAADIIAFLTAELEGVRFAVVRDHGDRRVAEPGYIELLKPEELEYWRIEADDLAALVTEPTLKLTARHPRLTADDLLDVLDRSGLAGFHATTSGAPFLEVAGAGVTKATGVARLCELLDVDATEVIAAGDAKNDIELLRWAGLGVAMGNAVPETLAAADWVTATNADDGLARAIEHVLQRR